MNDVPSLEHALYGGQDAGGYRFLAQSPGFREEWLPEAERLCTGFGERPAGVACPRAVFVQPFGKENVALVQAADQGRDDQGRPGALAFHITVMPYKLYVFLGGDPFHLAEQLPPPWTVRGHLTPLPCPAPAPARRIEDVRKILNVPHSATLLGAAQALLDGGRVAVERTAPDEPLLRGLWMLLPTASRTDYWPASFAFSNTLHFHAVALPRTDALECTGYLGEEQAGDYPEGKYELDLQTAAESGDQDTLDGLFARRSYREIQRIALVLLAVVIILPVMMGLLSNKDEKKDKPEQPAKKDSAPFEMPEAGRFAPLTPSETESLREQLLALAKRLDMKLPLTDAQGVLILGEASGPGGPLSTAGLLVLEPGQWMSLEALLDALDRRLGTPDAERAGRALRYLGPIERQLRGLLYKHAVERYNDLSLRPAELVERLEAKLFAEKKP